MSRPPGFYWVRCGSDYDKGWQVARWEQRECLAWWLTASELTFDDMQMLEIGPRIDPPATSS